MGDIVGRYETYTSKEFFDLTEHLVDENEKNVKFDIIKGAMEKCNIAAIGTTRLMDVLYKEDLDSKKQKMDTILKELWEE